MPNRKRGFSNPIQMYPMRATDLSSGDMKLLTEVLHIDTMSNEWRDPEVIQRINRLPVHLRRSLAYRLLPNSLAPGTTLCDMHKGINPYVIGDIYELAVDEVTVQFKCMDHYPELIPPEQAKILSSLKAIHGMWLEPKKSRPLPAGAWDFQCNECRACMLGRITIDRSMLVNFRITLLSRTRTKKKHQAPRLLKFIDQCIAQHTEWAADMTYYSGMRAYSLKEARKDAVRAYKKAKRDSKYGYVIRDENQAPSSNNAHQVPPSVHSPSGSLSRLEAENDRRIDSILASYGPATDPQTARTALSSVHGIPLAPDPLRVRKPGQPSPASSGHREPSTYVPPRSNPNRQRGRDSYQPSPAPSYRDSPQSYVPPRANPNLQQGRNSYQPSPVSLYNDPSQAYVPPRANPNWQGVHTSHLSPSGPPHQPSPARSYQPSPRAASHDHGKGKGRTQDSADLAQEYRNLIPPAAEYYSESEYSDGSWEDAPVYENPDAACTRWSSLYQYL